MTVKKLVAGMTISSSQFVDGFPRKPINIIWDYQEIKDDQECDQTKETVIQIN